MGTEWDRNDPSFGKENEETVGVTCGVHCETDKQKPSCVSVHMQGPKPAGSEGAGGQG